MTHCPRKIEESSVAKDPLNSKAKKARTGSASSNVDKGNQGAVAAKGTQPPSTSKAIAVAAKGKQLPSASKATAVAARSKQQSNASKGIAVAAKCEQPSSASKAIAVVAESDPSSSANKAAAKKPQAEKKKPSEMMTGERADELLARTPELADEIANTGYRILLCPASFKTLLETIFALEVRPQTSIVVAQDDNVTDPDTAFILAMRITSNVMKFPRLSKERYETWKRAADT